MTGWCQASRTVPERHSEQRAYGARRAVPFVGCLGAGRDRTRAGRRNDPPVFDGACAGRAKPDGWPGRWCQAPRRWAGSSRGTRWAVGPEGVRAGYRGALSYSSTPGRALRSAMPGTGLMLFCSRLVSLRSALHLCRTGLLTEWWVQMLWVLLPRRARSVWMSWPRVFLEALHAGRSAMCW